MKTIAVSKETYRKLIVLKEEFETSNMDAALEVLLSNYKRLLKKASLKKLIELNRKEEKVSVKELLEDRGRYGWSRDLY